MLRIAARLRGREDAQSVAKLHEIWREILEHEAWYITTKVRLAGVERNGVRTVDDQDVGQIVGEVMERVVRISKEFRGSEIGQFRKAINQAVEWTVLSYGEAQARKREREQVVNPAVFDPGSVDPEERPGFDFAAVIDATSVGDQLEAVERLKVFTMLSEREQTVVSRRVFGTPSFEIADELGLSRDNVDQIYSRALRKLRKLDAAGGADA